VRPGAQGAFDRAAKASPIQFNGVQSEEEWNEKQKACNWLELNKI
jgi:hypothetical protein